MPLWIMVDELNVDILEASYVLENRTPLGQFSAAFTNMVIRRTDEVRQTRKISLSRRTLRWSRNFGQLVKVYSTVHGGIRDDEATEVQA